MTRSTLSRRELLRRAAVVGAVGAGSGLLVACGGAPASDGGSSAGDAAADAGGASGLSCADSPDLTDADRQTRTALKYVDVSDVADQNCTNCVQYVAGAEGACGTCKVLPGPVNPIGHCSVWAAKPS